MNYEFIGLAIFSLVILYLIIWIFIKPFKVLMKIMMNSVIGSCCIMGFNFLMAKFGVWIGVNVVSALVCGVLGIPGFVLLGIGSFLYS